MASSIPGLAVTEHTVSVPLDWAGDPDGPTIDVFAREVVAAHRTRDELPLLLFLQGGPGGKSPRPLDASGWLGALLERYRVVLLDQRGTGRSTRVDGARMAGFDSGEAGAAYLRRFRGDSIIRDAEHLRRTVYGGRRWSTLGQSYGGFLTLTYLSMAPEALASCLVTGGLASVRPSAAEVYRRTYPRALAKNREYERRHPDDVALIGRIADRLAAEDVRLPDGDRLTVHRFQHLGNGFGMGPGFEELHWLVDEALTGTGGTFSDTFLAEVLSWTSFADGPLWAALQEAIYGDPDSGPTAWAAAAEHARHPEFASDARPLRFTGEMMYPWMFEEIRLLKPFRAAVQALAGFSDWTPLYDRERLAANEVPLAAAVYHDDLYVPADLQLETAAAVGNAQAWVTNEWEHDGIRASDDRVVRRLLQLVDERGGPLPS
ncbi:alpha/beta fold hydrolase [Amnibacterium sp. CER49]|uniref:alpha/beta fold hydrolase n=1 Tax=Amnibacterium sp. CER49 TaxID=3039161 RepID=UPI00244D6941|nr:alpha/beta fold hydrolase [Amnibacterium sp. CER49]MDH2443878.1 alpha/beta fold hydrolase [Amnibacterium sp. CER49]